MPAPPAESFGTLPSAAATSANFCSAFCLSLSPPDDPSLSPLEPPAGAEGCFCAVVAAVGVSAPAEVAAGASACVLSAVVSERPITVEERTGQARASLTSIPPALIAGGGGGDALVPRAAKAWPMLPLVSMPPALIDGGGGGD